MKIKLLIKNVAGFSLGIILFFLSCKKDDNTPQNVVLFGGTTYWECNMIALNPDTIRYYYLFSLTQDDNKLSGEIVVRDSTVQEKGFINGVVEQDSIFFSTNFLQNNSHFFLICIMRSG